MVATLVITLREGMEAALIVGIVLAYLAKVGRGGLARWVYWGLGLAVLGSLALAATFSTLNLDPENEYLEGTLLGAGGLMVASVVVWMWRTGRKLRGEVEHRLGQITGGSSRAGWALLLFTFFMVLREGAETVLFLAAAAWGQGFNIFSLLGGALGLGLAVLFAVLFIRGSLRINLSRFFTVTSLVLLALSLKLLGGSLHEFAEVGAIPMSPGVMQVLGFLVRDRTSTAILMGLLALPLFLVLPQGAQEREAVVEETRAAQRKRRAAQAQARLARMGLAAVVALILLAMGTSILARSPFYDPAPLPVTARDGKVSIPLIGLETGKLHKYSLDSQGVGIRFLVVVLSDGTVATALDACQICGPLGYMQEGPNAICKRCQAPIYMPTIGQGGGCNPLPLPAEVEGDAVIIRAEALAGAREVFLR